MRIGSSILIFILIISMLFNSVRIALTYAHYYFDPLGFIEKLCENKDKPELQCNGQCHLSKVISQETDQQTPMPEIDYREIVLFVFAKEKVKFYSFSSESKALDFYTINYNFLTDFRVYHPPKTMA